MAYVVIFEASEANVGANVSAAIKGIGEWAELTPKSYLLDTAQSVESVMESLHPLLGPSDSIWVFTASSPWSGYGDPIVDDYAHTVLGQAEDYVPRDWNDAKGCRT